MPSTYTTNLGVEKVNPGEQTGTWGGSLNTCFDLIDEAISGYVAVTLPATGSSGSPNGLPITDGASSNGRNAIIEFTDGGDLGGDAYVQLTPNDSERLIWVINSLTASRSIYLFQGTYDAGRDYVLGNGVTALVRFSGGGASSSYVYEVMSDTLSSTLAGDLDANNNDINNVAVLNTGDLTVNGTIKQVLDDQGTGAATIDVSTANRFRVNNTGGLTITFSNIPSGADAVLGGTWSQEGMIKIRNGASPGTITLAGLTDAETIGAQVTDANVDQILTYIFQRNASGTVETTIVWSNS